jgi:hypothetical protein
MVRPMSRPALAALIALAACGGDRTSPTDDARPDGGIASDDPDGGVAVCTDAIDVVFVLDVSSSMDFVLADLAADIGGVVDAANALAPDAHFGLVSFADNAALDLGGALEGGAVHTAAATLTASFGEVRRTYTDHDRNPGDGPDGPTVQNPICEENAPDALHLAASAFPWRAHATRVVIVATDDTFLESPDNYGDRDHDGDTTSTDYPREGDYPALHGVADTTAALREREIRVFAFARTSPPGLLERCGTDRRLAWSQIGAGWSAPYGTSEPFPAATDGGSFDLAQVQAGSLSLAATINQVVVESHCDDVE